MIHSIIKGDDVRVEELIVDNIAITAEGVQGRLKLIFPSTIYRLCKEVGVSFREFRDTKFIPVEKPITARVMVRTRGRNINYQQHEEEEDQPEPMQHDENEAEHKTQAQYLEELKAFKTRQDKLWSNRNNFYQRMRTQQGEMAKEIEEIKKFQVNQTLMGFRKDPLDKIRNEDGQSAQGNC
ncbi:hypothetical protein PIB30_082763 [Stylosanthes scabra]|uniref:Uncharacterized protein n=1 Tax=Stylosanthes scabra TaxID=79078 RepID=A0ABU6XT49_9FABA|nr:hypothetical protein [Stylosanthes scabra]